MHYTPYMGFLSLCVSFCLGLTTWGEVFAQTYQFSNWDNPMPTDTTIRSGKLPNGLTYILKRNPEPQGKASFYFAQRVGSIQEKEEQRGLAHFLEHMAFNGTKHYPDHKLVDFLKRHGIGFGEGINAFTSVDHTIYHIDDIDVTNDTVTDSVLLILRDWSGDISLEETEIDKERGVIESEWRGDENGQARIFKETVRHAFPEGHPYGTRLPIGEIEIIRTFPYQVLKDYYHTWYRTDLQGVIIAGDINVYEMEQKIKSLFGTIVLDKDLPERVYYEVPDHPKDPYAFVVTDPEAIETSISIHFTAKAETADHRATPASIRDSYLINMAIALMNGRFTDISYDREGNAPYFWAYLNHGPYLTAMSEEALTLTILTSEGKEIEGLEAALRDLKSALKYGFYESEYKKIKENFESHLGTGGIALQPSSQVANNMANHFATRLGRFISPEAEEAVMKRVREEVKVADIDSMLRVLTAPKRNLTIYVNAPTPSDTASYKLPNSGDLITSLNKIWTEEQVERYDYVEVPNSLMDEAPKGGVLISREEGQIFNSTKLTLGNGVEVYLLKNEADPGHVTLSGISEGGLYLYNYDQEGAEIKGFNTFATIGGMSHYSPQELYKITMNSHASASTQVTPLAEAVSGSSTIADFEQMMQTIYLKFTQNRKDSIAFEETRSSLITEVERQAKEGGYGAIMSTELPKILYPDSLVHRVLPLSKEELQSIDYNRILEIYDERFSNASDFRFFVVGGFDEDEIIPLITKYLGALPTTNGLKESTDYAQIVPYNKIGTKKHFTYQSVTPITHLYDSWVAPLEYSFKVDLTMQILNSILDGLFVQTIREEESGTYGIAVLGQAVRAPGESSLYVNFQVDPTSATRLNDRVKEEIQKLAQGEMDEELFHNAKKEMREDFYSMQTQSGYWLTMLLNAVTRNKDGHTTYLEVLDSITPDNVVRLVHELTQSPMSRYFELRADGLPKKPNN